MTDKKKVGLLIQKKVEELKLKRSSIFDEDSDEDETSHKRPKIPQKKMESKPKIKTESLVDLSIYEYDDVYDEMKLKRAEAIAPKEKKNSRIETLLKTADKRKKEYERRLDRKIQVEREKEVDKYKDKEAFVTSEYKKKMEEQEAEEERERQENMLNEMMDVTKQKDLSGFYRHFLKQTVGEEKVPEFGERQIENEILSDEEDSFHHKQGIISRSHTNVDRDKDDSFQQSVQSPKDYKSKEIGYSSQRQCKSSKDYKRGQSRGDVEMESDNDNSSHKFRKSSKDIHLIKDCVETDSEDNSSDKFRKSLKTTKQNYKDSVSYKHQEISTEGENIDQDSDGIETDRDEDDDDSAHKHSKIVKASHKIIIKVSKEGSYSQKLRKSSEDSKNVDQDSDGVEIDSDGNKDKNLQRKSSSKSCSRNDNRKYLCQKSSDKEYQRSKRTGLLCNIKSNQHKNYEKSDSKLSGQDSNSSLSDDDNDKKQNKKTGGGRDQCPSEKVPKKNIYEKRTVGDIFSEAQARYFQRIVEKNARM